MKTHKFQQYDVSLDFGILFGTWKSIVMSYPCVNFYHDMTINKGINCIFMFFSVWTSQNKEVVNFMQIFFHT